VKRLLPALLSASLAVAGCVSDDQDTDEGRAAADVVQKFAMADGPDACDYLSGDALQDNYGGRSYSTGHDNCEEAAGKFEGERVTIKRAKITSDTTARVDAESSSGRLYVISLSKPQDDWVIERITQQRRE
jgi:hypothetical protein